MNKITFLIVLLFTCCISFSQTYYPYQDIKLETASDYKDAAPIALHAATWMLSTPFKNEDADRARALQFLMKWMSGTKEFKFQLQGKVQDIIAERDLFGLYTAAMAKFCLENKSFAGTPQVVESSACKLVLDYCDDPANNFTLKKILDLV